MSTSETFSFRIADRLRGVDSSPVRDLLDVVSKEGVISFAGGVPDPEYFEVADIKAAYDWVFEHQPQRALQYASSEGERELREQAARRLSRHLPTAASQITSRTRSRRRASRTRAAVPRHCRVMTGSPPGAPPGPRPRRHHPPRPAERDRSGSGA